MLMPFTSEVVMLSLGLAAGYWLLISADKYQGRLNRIGEVLAWVLIASTVFFTVCNLLFALSSMNLKHYTPVNGPNSPGVGQTVINEGEFRPARPSATPEPANPTQQGQQMQQTTEGTTGAGKPVTNQGKGPFGTP